MKITMNYLKQIELFIIKKLLLETGDEPTEYLLQDFNDTEAKVIIDCLLRLAEEDSLSISGIKIGCDFFETIFLDFIEVDFNERGRPVHAGVNYGKIKDCDYVGLSKKTFEKYDKECCFESSILEPDLDLEVNAEELKYIVKNSSHFPVSYGNSLFENLTFSVCQSKKQKEKLEKYLNEYLEKFRNDDLERRSATDYYKYAKQKEMLDRTIVEIGRNYPIKNLWLKESNVNFYGNPNVAIINDSAEHFNFLETLFCLEQESDKGKGIKIEELDKEKGIRITDYSEKQEEIKAYSEERKRLFAEMDEKQEEKESLKKEIIEEIKSGQRPIPEIDRPNGKPYTEIKNGKGYFKFYKQGENIEIGSGSTRHFRLLQCLCEPYFGVQKTIEAIFEAIRLPKDKNDNDLLSYSPQRKTKILILIEYAKKELQKNKKLQGRIRYKFDDRKSNMWMELEE